MPVKPSVSYGKATSYLPVIDLLKGYFKIGDRDDHREMRNKVMGRVLGLGRALEPLLPPLLALLDVPVEDPAWQTLDPPQRRQRTLDAIKRLLLRESQVQPLLVVFEDLYWVDGETQVLLDNLVDSLGSARLLLLVNYRPEYQHGWSSKTAYSQLRLDALPAESAGELLEALLGNDPGLAPLKQLLIRRGNPFFLEETVRTLVETEALAGERGRYRLAQPIQTLQVPPTVQTILAARIDRLSPEDKQLLQVASVVGKDVPFTVLQAIAGLPDDALRGGLDRLQAAEFLYEDGLYPDLEYSFKHALTHDVTHGGLLQERRRELHARIVEAIETLHRDRLGEHLEWLAHHAFRAEAWDKAREYLRRAGQKAVACSANREAVTWFEQTLRALSHLSDSSAVKEEMIDVRLELRVAVGALGQYEHGLDVLLPAEALARELGDRRRLGWVWRRSVHDVHPERPRRAGAALRGNCPCPRSRAQRPRPPGGGEELPHHDRLQSGRACHRRQLRARDDCAPARDSDPRSPRTGDPPVRERASLDGTGAGAARRLRRGHYPRAPRDRACRDRGPSLQRRRCMDLGVEALTDGVGDAVSEEAQDVWQVALDHASSLDHGRQP
jgi:hypothetical protein